MSEHVVSREIVLSIARGMKQPFTLDALAKKCQKQRPDRFDRPRPVGIKRFKKRGPVQTIEPRYETSVEPRVLELLRSELIVADGDDLRAAKS